MITIFVKNYNSFDKNFQNFYDDLISNLSLNMLTCPCCKHKGCFVIHGYYQRFIISNIDSKLPLIVTRVKCTCCKHTHTIIPSSLIPYCQIQLKDIVTAISLYQKHIKISKILDSVPSLDRTNLYHLIYIFIKFWKEKLLSFKITLNSLCSLVIDCFSKFLTQFMQIAKIPNILFFDST